MPRKKHQRLQQWERDAIVEAYRAGEKGLSIAYEFNCDEATVGKVARRAGVPKRQHTRGKVKGPTKRFLASIRRANVALRAGRA